MENKHGGNVPQYELERLFASAAAQYHLNISHKKSNRWNFWQKGVNLTLSFVINNGLFIPSLSGQRTETLEKFYSSNPSIVDEWIKEDIKYYYKVVDEIIRVPIQTRQTLVREPEHQHVYIVVENSNNININTQPQQPEKPKTLTKKPRRNSKQCEGQMSLFDVDDRGNYVY